MPDIDIDFADRTIALEKFKHVVASIDEDGTFKKHNSGEVPGWGCDGKEHFPRCCSGITDFNEADSI